MWTGGFPEPLTFSLRARHHLGPAQGPLRRGARQPDASATACWAWPGTASRWSPPIHHPVTVDRRLELEAAATRLKRLSLRRWYAFTRMQRRVAAPPATHIITVSGSSKAEITEHLGAAPGAVSVVPIGADTRLWSPVRVGARWCPAGSSPPPARTCRSRAWSTWSRRSPRCAPSGTRTWWWSARSRAAAPVADAVRRFGLEPHIEFVHRPDRRRSWSTCYRSRRGGLRALALRGLLAARRRGDGHRHRRWSPPPAARSPRWPGRTARPAWRCRRATPTRWPARSAGCWTTRSCARRLGAAGRERVLARFTWERAAELTAERYRAAIATGAGQRARSGAGWRYVA